MATIWSAIASKDPKQLEALIKAGGDVNMVGGGDQTPLHLACECDAVECTKVLVAHGADLNAEDGQLRSPLLLACESAAAGSAAVLIDKGAPLACTDKNDATPLHWLSFHGLVDLLALALSRGADKDARNLSMQTPLYLAVSKLKYECAMKLLDAGANVHHADDARRTPLHAAMQHGEGGDALLALLNRLLQLGAAVGAVDREQRTPLHWASEGRAAARHRADHGEGGRQRDGLGAARAAPLGVPDGRPRVRRRPPQCEGDPVGPGPRPAHAAPLGGRQAALKCLTLLLGQTGISVRARLPAAPAAVPARARASASPPRPSPAPRPSLSTPHHPSPPFQVDAVDWGGFSALHYAARRSSRECIEALLAKGADAASSHSDEQPIDMAAEADVKKLLQDDAPGLKRRRCSRAATRSCSRASSTLAEKFYAAAAAAKSAAQVKELLTPAAFADATTSKAVAAAVGDTLAVTKMHVDEDGDGGVELTHNGAPAVHLLTFDDDGLVARFGVFRS